MRPPRAKVKNYQYRKRGAEMKYDSGMTGFNKDIIAVLRYMLKGNKEITEKFSPNDGSPAPLREYLKNKYGKSCMSHIGDGMRYSCKAASGLELTFGIILNNPGDKNLTLSWSQTAKFIRDNWDELFKKPEVAEQPSPQISYIDKLREKYPKVNETDGWFDTVYCPSDLFDGDGVNDPADDKCSYTAKDDEACQKCWRERCPANVALLTDPNFEDEYFENYPGEEPTNSVPETETVEGTTEAENKLIPQNASKISETFNYAVLSSELGDFLKRKEQQLKNEYMNFTANCGAIFAEVQEKLAKDGHGTFIKWIEAMGFKTPTVYRMIDVYKFRLSLIEKDGNGTQEIFDNLPKYLQYDISAKSAPAELVEQVLNGDITTHKDYIALKKQLEEANKRVENEEKARAAISQNLSNMEEGYVEFKNKYSDEYYKNQDLEKRIKEFESRPIDVYVDSNEVNKRVAEAVSKINSETEQTLAAREQEFAETLHFKDERIWALEDKLKELGGSPGTDKKIYLLSMTDEDYRKMLAELNGSSFRNILEAAAIVDIK